LPKKAYILIESQPGLSSQLVNDLENIKEVTAVDFVSGPYDFIAEIEVDEVDDIGSLITQAVHPIHGIDRTVTCISIE